MANDTPDVSAARRRILAEHAETVGAVVDAADAVAATWDGPTTRDRGAVAPPLERAIRTRGLDDRLVSVLVDAVATAGRELVADPVPAPPYLAVTGQGPVLRGSVEDGRIVLTMAVFAVLRDGGAAYRRAGSDPAEVVAVEFREA